MSTDRRPSGFGRRAGVRRSLFPPRLASEERSWYSQWSSGVGSPSGVRAVLAVEHAARLARRRLARLPRHLGPPCGAQDADPPADDHAGPAERQELPSAQPVPPACPPAALAPFGRLRPGRLAAVKAAAAVGHRRLAAGAAGSGFGPAARRHAQVAGRVAVPQPSGRAGDDWWEFLGFDVCGEHVYDLVPMP
jgi:hypothetical protein